MKRAGACQVAIALTLLVLSACRTFSYRGVRCSVPGEPCLGGLVCRDVSSEADGGTNFCLEPLDGGSEDADAGADTDAGADAGADAGSDAGADAGVDAGPDAGVGLDAGQWLTPVLLETDNTGNASAPAISMNARGDGIVVWQQVVDGRFGVWANRFDAEDGGWDGPLLIEQQSVDSGTAYPNVAINSGGNAIAVWSAPEGTRRRIRAAWYSPSLARWSDAGIIDADGGGLGDAYYPRAVLDPLGNATVAWQQTISSGKDRVWARRFVSDAGWSDGGAIDPAPDASSMDFRIALDGQRNVTVAWITDSRSVLAARLSTDATNWGAHGTLEPNIAGALYAVSIATNKNGEVAVIWRRDAPNIISSAWYNSSTGSWTVPIEIRQDAGTGTVAIGLSDSGNGIAVWIENTNMVYGRHFLPGIDFAEPHISLSGIADAGVSRFYVSLAMNGRGDAVVVWMKPVGSTGRFFSNRFVATTSAWLGEVSVVGDPSGDVSDSPAIGIDEDGGAIAVWVERNSGKMNIWSSRSR